MKSNSKTLLIINIYRIPATIPSEGTYSSLIQYNLIDRKAKTAIQYRNELIEEIETYVKANQDITDIILAGDLN